MSFVTGLRCRECGYEQGATAEHVCPECYGPLEVAYDYEAIRGVISRQVIAARPASLWRYAELLPTSEGASVDLGDGYTPLVRADRLAAEVGLGEVWIKNDTMNPSGSFKDRPVSVALAMALQLGLEVAACASTGNLGNSVAAHATHAGMRSFVFVPYDLEPNKILGSAVYDTTLVAVKGSYDDINRLCIEIADEEPKWAFVNQNIRPYYGEGSKTIAFEIAEQLGWELPDHVLIPVASGCQLIKVAQGFRELAEVGLVPGGKTVRMSGAQAEGCSPVSAAWRDGRDDIIPVKSTTIAKSLAIGSPADGGYVLREVRSSGGGMAAVSDQEIIDGVRLLARTEGIFTETAGGVTVASLRQLAAEGIIRRDERVVVNITGHGLKTPEVIAPYVAVGPAVPPNIDAVLELLERPNI